AVAPDKPSKPPGRSGKVVSLSGQFPATRDQGHRGTCVAFASEAFFEYHISGGSTRPTHHSEQYLFWACKQADGAPLEDGTHLKYARKVLASPGVCLAKTWPYDPLPGATIDQGPPPDRATAEAARFIFAEARDLTASDIDAIKASIDDRKPVVL